MNLTLERTERERERDVEGGWQTRRARKESEREKTA